MHFEVADSSGQTLSALMKDPEIAGCPKQTNKGKEDITYEAKIYGKCHLK